MNIYDRFGHIIIEDVPVLDESKVSKGIMASDAYDIVFVWHEYIDIPLLSYIEVDKLRRHLYYDAEVTKHSDYHYEYRLSFHSVSEEFKSIKFKYYLDDKPAKTKFPLTATAREFIDLILLNVNMERQSRGLSSIVCNSEDCIDTPRRTIAFNGEDCYSALSMVAQEFATEWMIIEEHREVEASDGVIVVGDTDTQTARIIVGKIEKDKDNPLSLAYGKGNGLLSGLKKESQHEHQPVKRLYVMGGERNINPEKYHSKTLLLPKGKTFRHYEEAKTYFRSDERGLYIEVFGEEAPYYGREEIFDGTMIYPHKEHEVTKVEKIEARDDKGSVYYKWDIYDTKTTPIDYGKYVIPGEKAQITFQSGRLAGRTFDIMSDTDNLTGYIHSERKFMLVNTEQDGILMPEDKTFYPEVGDRFLVFGIELPNEYICDDDSQSGASWTMFREAIKYFEDNFQPKIVYSGSLDPIYIRKNRGLIDERLRLGYFVRFEDKDIGKARSVRITGISYPFNDPDKIDITLSNSTSESGFSATMARLNAEEVLRQKSDLDIKFFTLETAKEMMQKDYLKRVIKDGRTDVDGGLILTNVLGLRNIIGGMVRAYIDGNNTRGVAFAAGVNDAFTENETRRVEINHDGSAKFGQLYIQDDGVVNFKEPEKDTPYFSINGDIPSLSEFEVFKYFREEHEMFRYPHRYITPISNRTQNYEVKLIKIYPKDGYIDVNFEVGFDYSPASKEANRDEVANLSLYLSEYDDVNNTLKRVHLGNASIPIYTPSGRVINVRKRVRTDKVYCVYATMSVQPYWIMSLYAKVMDENYLNPTIKRTYIGRNGMFIFLGNNKLFYINKDNNPFLTIKGRTDMPGVLFSCSVMLKKGR